MLELTYPDYKYGLTYIELKFDAHLHEPGVLLDSVRDPTLHPVPHALLRLRGHSQLNQAVVRTEDGVILFSNSVREATKKSQGGLGSKGRYIKKISFIELFFPTAIKLEGKGGILRS